MRWRVVCALPCVPLYVRPHLQDVHLALGQVAPVALLEALLGQAGEVDAVQGLHLVTEAFEDATDDAVLAGVDLDAQLTVVMGVDVLELVGGDRAVGQFDPGEDLLLVLLGEGVVQDDLVDFLLVVGRVG